MKVMTVLGTRPEIIRLSRVVPKLDESCEHVLVHTGQNYDERLNDIFFQELGMRAPDHAFQSRAPTAMEQIATIIVEMESLLLKEKPDRLLILGDTNSGLAAYVAKRNGIPVYHMEAGNRCFDDRVPEEVNRRVIDHSSDILMPYTERSRANLLREGIASDRVFVTGNPIKEVLDFYGKKIKASSILSHIGVEENGYFLVTLHRAENVDEPERLARYVKAIDRLAAEHDLPVVWSMHPRTRSRLANGVKLDRRIKICEPFGLFDFVHLEQKAACVLSDSGTVQEECCIFHVANVTLRDVTERPETVECGSNIIAGSDPDTIISCAKVAMEKTGRWKPPAEYMVDDVSSTVRRICLGFRR
jgi:UDP-N-acetylglucosamine 2-epimerase (non-hydrolysing)